MVCGHLLKRGVSGIILRDMIIAFFDILLILIFIRIILSWFPVNPYGNPTLMNIIYLLKNISEPFLAPFKSIIPPVRMGGGYLDLSPIVALFVLRIIRNLLLSFL